MTNVELPGLLSCLFHLPGSVAQAMHVEEAEAFEHVSGLGLFILAGAVLALVATGVQVFRHMRHEDGRKTPEGSI